MWKYDYKVIGYLTSKNLHILELFKVFRKFINVTTEA